MARPQMQMMDPAMMQFYLQQQQQPAQRQQSYAFAAPRQPPPLEQPRHSEPHSADLKQE